MRIICFSGFKGGVGKSLINYNIGGILAGLGYNVLLIDSDMQENLTYNTGVSLRKGQKTIYNIYEASVMSGDPVDPSEIIVKSPIKELPTLDLIPASIFLHKVDLMIANEVSRELILGRYLKKNIDVFQHYDYIFIDTNPSMNLINQNAFFIADDIILMSDVGINALEGVDLFMALWNDKIEKSGWGESNISGVLINDYDKRLKMAKDYVDFIEEHKLEISRLLFKTKIPRNTKLAETETSGPINLYDTRAKSYEALLDLLREMGERDIIEKSVLKKIKKK